MHAATSRGDTEGLLKCLKKETPLLSLYPHSRSGIRSRVLPGAQRHHRPCSCFVPKDLSQEIIQAYIHGRTEIQTAFLLHKLHVLPIYLIPQTIGSHPVTHLRGQDELCYFHSLIKAQWSISDPGPIVDILTFVTWWLRLHQHALRGSAGNLSWRKRLLPTH